MKLTESQKITLRIFFFYTRKSVLKFLRMIYFTIV